MNPDPCPECDGAGMGYLTDGSTVACGVCKGTTFRPARMLATDECDRLWSDASTHSELCELTACWLEGRLPRAITYDRVPNADEASQIPEGLLADLNRAGFLTDWSQPGHGWVPGFDGSGYRQRAYVEFLVPEASVQLLAWAAAFHISDDGLWVNARKAPWFSRRLRSCNDLPVTEVGEFTANGAQAVTWAGRPVPRTYWRWIGLDHGNRAMGRILASCYQVSIADLEWGRNDLLWDTLATLTTMKETTT